MKFDTKDDFILLFRENNAYLGKIMWTKSEKIIFQPSGELLDLGEQRLILDCSTACSFYFKKKQ